MNGKRFLFLGTLGLALNLPGCSSGDEASEQEAAGTGASGGGGTGAGTGGTDGSGGDGNGGEGAGVAVDPEAQFRLHGPPEREYHCTARDLGGGIFEDEFTDSFGNTNTFRYELPISADPPLGVFGYFHGNSPAGSTFDPPPEASYLNGYVAFSGMSEGEASDDTMGWETKDHNWVYELLKSNLNGCVPQLDSDRVILQGGSQGTCFLNDFLQAYWQEFSGGILSECGCFSTMPHPGDNDLEEMRERWKIYVQNSTGDFLFEDGVRSYEYFKHALGLDVVGDLEATGGHCSGGLVDVNDVLEWIEFDEALTDPAPAVESHWEHVTSPMVLPGYYHSLAGRGDRLVRLIERANIPQDEEHLLLREWLRNNWDQTAGEEFEAWVESEFGKHYVLYESPDYGSTWTELARDLPAAINSIALDADGVVLIPTTAGLMGVSTDGTLSTVHFDGQEAPAVQANQSGHLLAVAGNDLWRRDLMGTWSEIPLLSFLGRSYGETFIWRDFEGYRISADGGETSTAMNTPDNVWDIFALGNTVYTLDGLTNQLSQSTDLGATFGSPVDVAGGFFQLFLAPNGDLLSSDAQLGGSRSTDGGITWVTEHAFNGVRGDTMIHLAGGRMITAADHGLVRPAE